MLPAGWAAYEGAFAREVGRRISEFRLRLAAYRVRAVPGITVWPEAAVAVPGLGDAVDGGRLTVSGFAVFDPATPFRPNPAFPTSRTAAGGFVSFQDIYDADGFT